MSILNIELAGACFRRFEEGGEGSETMMNEDTGRVKITRLELRID